ncbi:hypothetical protein EJ05DRAFT_442463 [Pseudovirgaria hyperparasitica]|uniref:Nudix hydrolase domain-containing protein n=1 Tax=Pseudovirgaria hyperparasitica TaxID=470096 RepID=A0A6A6VZE5_9PEZI|nr:uncharacterized protein EJ05DRAFT_442463 [Pseudovirgaria hyperparasitica]KAF2755249.1 hypothetical protein EJ05DRAFT_442463 [Pseudovirgaria hyperparasitica]
MSSRTPGKGLEKGKAPAVPKPSSSVILISPENQALLLHRVKTSSSFPSAHVFPGGNVDMKHDGPIPDPQDPKRHEDGPAYRMAAIRETFEESGILLATSPKTGKLVEISDEEREHGRKAIHSGEIMFQDWLASKDAIPDTALDALIPFTRWVTPTNVPKRFTTQMYIYFLPLSNTSRDAGASATASLEGEKEVVIPVPTPDGGVEHTAARFLPPWKWLSLARQNRIILFPPQFFLLSLAGQYLSPEGAQKSTEVFQKERKALIEFINDPNTVPSWGDKCMSPLFLLKRKSDGRTVLGLNKPGIEAEQFNRTGDDERVVFVNFKKEGPRDVEVAWKKDVYREERAHGEKEKL